MITRSGQALLLEGIHTREPVAGLTHSFYRYPARFSPLFARAAIRAFTRPGDVVYDPFMGGGTTIVEAAVLGRRPLGTDINSLAVFLAEVKTTVLTRRQLTAIRRWAECTVSKLSVWSPPQRASGWIESGYQRNINTRETWRIRKLIELALAESAHLKTREEERFARCIVLKTGQWALDCRKDIPPVSDFRQQFHLNAGEMTQAAGDYARRVIRAAMRQSSVGEPKRPLCLHRSAVGVDQDSAATRYRPIRLVLTSPPYPGVHVLYHRWQVQGRCETPAPFWVASSIDGNGASYYTFGDRKEQKLDTYFEQALAAFRSIGRLADKNTLVVQMLAFSEPECQLARYVAAMKEAGLAEVKFPELANAPDGRVWRSIPNRKWYASQRGTTNSSNEVVLFHVVRP